MNDTGVRYLAHNIEVKKWQLYSMQNWPLGSEQDRPPCTAFRGYFLPTWAGVSGNADDLLRNLISQICGGYLRYLPYKNKHERAAARLFTEYRLLNRIASTTQAM